SITTCIMHRVSGIFQLPEQNLCRPHTNAPLPRELQALPHVIVVGDNIGCRQMGAVSSCMAIAYGCYPQAMGRCGPHRSIEEEAGCACDEPHRTLVSTQSAVAHPTISTSSTPWLRSSSSSLVSRNESQAVFSTIS